jgi:hypothetical protein
MALVTYLLGCIALRPDQVALPSWRIQGGSTAGSDTQLEATAKGRRRVMRADRQFRAPILEKQP